MRHTKIVATIGPASDNEQTLDRLVAAGVDIFRLNLAHGSEEGNVALIERARRAAARANRIVGLLADLSGPKLRTGPLVDGRPLHLERGDRLVIATGDFAGERLRVSTPNAALADSVRPGDRLLIDDGRIELRVESAGGGEIGTVVVHGGPLGERKGINAPGVRLPPGALTDKDEADLRFAVDHGVDMLGLSFVRSPADLHQTRALLASCGGERIPIVAKLERPEALEHLDEIVDASDGVMVARGDLGLEMPLEQVPRAQRTIIERARARGKPVIVATQVLESMRVEPRPTRAEVSDAAHAVESSVDAIMLAGETAVGVFPVEAVEMLDLVIREAEKGMDSARLAPRAAGRGHGRALCDAAVTLADRADAIAIAAVTRFGVTARLLSALRPMAPILAATVHPSTAHRVTLHRGVTPIIVDTEDDLERAAVLGARELRTLLALPEGGVIVLVGVTHELTSVASNFIKLIRL